MVHPKSLYLWITLLLLPSCGVDVRSTVPDAPVYYEIDFASSEALPLRQPSGYLRIEERTVENSAIGLGDCSLFIVCLRMEFTMPTTLHVRTR